MPSPCEQLVLVKEAVEKFEQMFLAHSSANGLYSANIPSEGAWCFPWHDVCEGYEGGEEMHIYADLGPDKGILHTIFLNTREHKQIRCDFEKVEPKASEPNAISWWLGQNYTYNWLEYKQMVFETWSYAGGNYLGSTETHDKAYWFIGDPSDVSYINHYADAVEQVVSSLLTNKDYELLAKDIIKTVRNDQPEWHSGRVRWTYIKELDELIRELELNIAQMAREDLAQQKPAETEQEKKAINKPNGKSHKIFGDKFEVWGLTINYKNSWHKIKNWPCVARRIKKIRKLFRR